MPYTNDNSIFVGYRVYLRTYKSNSILHVATHLLHAHLCYSIMPLSKHMVCDTWYGSPSKVNNSE